MFGSLLLALMIFPRSFAQPGDPNVIKAVMLFRHNDARRRVANCHIDGQPPASQLDSLMYDPDLADLAAARASSCVRPDQRSQNSNASTINYSWAGSPSLTGAFRSWFTQSRYYSYIMKTCSRECGDYQRVVTSSYTRIGCGYYNCSHVDNAAFVLSVLCYYAPRIPTSEDHNLTSNPYEMGNLSRCLNYRISNEKYFARWVKFNNERHTGELQIDEQLHLPEHTRYVESRSVNSDSHIQQSHQDAPITVQQVHDGQASGTKVASSGSKFTLSEEEGRNLSWLSKVAVRFKALVSCLQSDGSCN